MRVRAVFIIPTIKDAQVVPDAVPAGDQAIKKDSISRSSV